jgi:hypothetical protein
MFGVSEDQIRSTRELSVYELIAMIPRKVRLYGDDSWKSVFFFLAFLGVGLIWIGGVAYRTFQQMKEREALRYQGREVLATITKISGTNPVRTSA